MFLGPELWRHMNRCSSKPGDNDHHGRKRVLGLVALVKSACCSTDDGMLKMLSCMHDDEISNVVRNDSCLLRFAESLYSKHGHDASKHDYIHQKTRQLGRFLQTLRRKTSIQTLEDAIKPNNFMKVIEAVKETSGFEKDKNSYKTPSLALKIGHSLLKISDIIRCHALMAGDEDLVKSSEAFQKLSGKMVRVYFTLCSEYYE
ncbi:Nudix hydrolase 5 [Labeo rohita]|uniref:Nudix hydrolase 5 n=1 Tax=Labeo rohita TaxID=84645 RepID=A0ABQ8L5J7_LABRO|nr:Nudix hydrolase 5 [Labeo rohita]